MLKCNTPLPEVDQMVSRPVINAVLQQVSRITNIPKETPVTFIGQNNSRLQFSHVTSPLDAPVRLANDRGLIIEIDEEPDEGMFNTTAGNQAENNLDFLDKSLGVVLKPIYYGVDIVMTVTFRTHSRSEAIRWRNDARYKASQQRLVNLHVVEYSYQIPLPALDLLRHIHSLREKHYGYAESFEQWTAKCFTTRATQASTVTGTHPEYIIKEAQDMIQGTFDFTANPRRQERNEGDAWEVSFTYTFSYHKPVEYSMQYPLIVHQQVIDDRFILRHPSNPYEDAKRMTLSRGAFYYLNAPVYQYHLTQRQKYFSPEHDTWLPNIVPSGSTIVASFLVSVEQGPDKQILLNLNELGDYMLDPDILEWIKAKEYPIITIPAMSALTVSLYRNECLSSDKGVAVDKDGNVWLTEKADGRKRYRVTIALTNNLGKISIPSIKGLVEYPDALIKIIQLTHTPSGVLNSWVEHVDLSEFIKTTVNAGWSRDDVIQSLVRPKTVMVGTVQTWRAKDLKENNAPH